MNPKTAQKIMDMIFKTSGALTILILTVIICYILSNGFKHITMEFMFTNPVDSGKSGGILPMIVSTVYLMVISMMISIPVGVGSAIYLSEYSNSAKLNQLIRYISQTLTAIPSIVYGLFGLTFLVFFLKLGWSILSGAIVLALMSVPTIFQVSHTSISAVPQIHKEGCYGIGATKWQCIKAIVIPYALPGIITGIILALTRAISEAAAVMYVVGSSLETPVSIFDAGRPLPLHLYMLANEGLSFSNAYAVASVLIIMVLLITVSMNYLVKYYQKKIHGV